MPRTSVLWLAGVAGLVVGAGGYAIRKEPLLRWSAMAGSRVASWSTSGAALFERYLVIPQLELVEAVEGATIGRGESGLALSLAAFGRSLRALGRQAPALALLFVLLAGVLLVVAIVSPGLVR